MRVNTIGRYRAFDIRTGNGGDADSFIARSEGTGALTVFTRYGTRIVPTRIQ